MNVIDAAIDRGVKQVIALSTDKACNPINLYGATKLCSDKLFITGNVYVGSSGIPKFSIVRYGNVLGSRGSIIPRWRQLLAEGAQELSITDPRMTRFWISLDEAAEFVITNLNRMLGGEIFVPKIPSMTITDLAEAIQAGIKTKVIGIRPGEKLHESMIGEDDARHCFEFDDCYSIFPEVQFNEAQGSLISAFTRSGKNVPEGFTYTSDKNKQWLKVPELRAILQKLGL